MFGLVPFGRRGMERRNGDLFDIDNFFDDFFNEPTFPVFFGNAGNMRVDIKENEKEYVLEAEMPGVRKEDINIEINDNRLTISANRDERVEEKRDNYIRKERRTSSMARSFSIDNVEADKITAKHENGVLTLILPKKEQSKPRGRKIDIM
ncbi:MAG TPA: Hsp20/alpha crystallin family protein [Acetivibrio sp.]|nr:Hsp20/alpha crystallin family protein [Clostridium sp.]HOQ38265.1 Hsp20/alpha crystallin family protein [Acetivibrio sp.]HPT91639.1 Hsp20/alpha crystallin family protein [Acetivibrio sp.]HQA56483.1 Hsp20/alpha crystallin family protein [Acetivibrio sp.]